MQSRRGSCRKTFNNSPAVRASTGGASSLNASGRLLARTTRSVISSSPRYRLRSGEGSSSGGGLLGDMRTPPCTCQVHSVGTACLEQKLGDRRSLPGYEIKVQLRVASVGSFTAEPISLPGRGPGSATRVFRDLCLSSGKIMLTPSPGHKQGQTLFCYENRTNSFRSLHAGKHP